MTLTHSARLLGPMLLSGLLSRQIATARNNAKRCISFIKKKTARSDRACLTLASAAQRIGEAYNDPAARQGSLDGKTSTAK